MFYEITRPCCLQTAITSLILEILSQMNHQFEGFSNRFKRNKNLNICLFDVVSHFARAGHICFSIIIQFQMQFLNLKISFCHYNVVHNKILRHFLLHIIHTCCSQTLLFSFLNFQKISYN